MSDSYDTSQSSSVGSFPYKEYPYHSDLWPSAVRNRHDVQRLQQLLEHRNNNNSIDHSGVERWLKRVQLLQSAPCLVPSCCSIMTRSIIAPKVAELLALLPSRGQLLSRSWGLQEEETNRAWYFLFCWCMTLFYVFLVVKKRQNPRSTRAPVELQFS